MQMHIDPHVSKHGAHLCAQTLPTEKRLAQPNPRNCVFDHLSPYKDQSVIITTEQLAKFAHCKPAGDGTVTWRAQDFGKVLKGVRDLLKALPPDDKAVTIEAQAPDEIIIATALAICAKGALAVLSAPHSGRQSFAIHPVTPRASGGTKTSKFRVWRVKETFDFTLVDFALPPDCCAESIPLVVPPKVKGSKGVVLSVAGPQWLAAHIAVAYGTQPWLAYHAADGDATILCRNSNDGRRPGRIITAAQLRDAWMSEKPMRGEIWSVDLPLAGLHPCLVLSLDARNSLGSDTIVIPFSSDVERHKGNPCCITLEPRETGLHLVSVARCDNISTVPQKMLKQRIGRVSADLLASVKNHLAYAIGGFM